MSRLFSISLEPVPNEQLLPALRGRHRSTFHEPVSIGSNRVPAPFEPDSKLFFENLWDLAASISTRLKTMYGEDKAAMSPAPPMSGTASGLDAEPKRTVLLAQVTEDLVGDCAMLRRALEQHPSLRILPDGDYPQGGEAFREAFRADLAESDFVVQLLSSISGRAPRDLPEGYVRSQANEAANGGAELLQWRRSDLQLAQIADADYRALLQRQTVIASTLPSFIDEVIKKVTAPPPAPAVRDGAARSFVFVNADKRDLVPAKQCAEELASECDYVLPPEEDEQKGASVQEDLNTYLASCNAVLLVQGSSDSGWIRGQLLQALKIRGRDIRGAVLHGPPNGKRPINMKIQGIEELDCSADGGTGWRFDRVHEFVGKAQRT
jgi:hypothetical protein